MMNAHKLLMGFDCSKLFQGKLFHNFSFMMDNAKKTKLADIQWGKNNINNNSPLFIPL